jgi:uncharacterized membrane protein YidH (DUF202 family)
MPSSNLNNAALNDFISKVTTLIIIPLVTLLIGIAFIVFLWGVVDYIRSADNDEKRKTGQQHMLWGFVGFVIIFGAGAIIQIIMALVSVFGGGS